MGLWCPRAIELQKTPGQVGETAGIAGESYVCWSSVLVSRRSLARRALAFFCLAWLKNRVEFSFEAALGGVFDVGVAVGVAKFGVEEVAGGLLDLLAEAALSGEGRFDVVWRASDALDEVLGGGVVERGRGARGARASGATCERARWPRVPCLQRGGKGGRLKIGWRQEARGTATDAVEVIDDVERELELHDVPHVR